MKRIFALGILCCAVFVFALVVRAEDADLSSGSWNIALTGRKITLEEAYALALKRSETIAQDADAVKQALARVDELKSDILPQISLNGMETLQENPNIPGFPSSFNTTSLPQAEVTLLQPLFSGFREFLAFKQGKVQAQSQSLTEQRAQELLYQDVAQAYFNLITVQEQIHINQDIIKSYKERIGQLRHWVSIGRSRESEVLAARSQMAQSEAQVELLGGQEDVGQEMLKFLTGLDERLMPEITPSPKLGSLDDCLTRAQHRSDVESARENFESMRLGTEIVRRSRWPIIGLTADYYLIRSGFSESTHYDAILAASMPIFDWGKIGYQTKESKAVEDSAGQALSLAERGAARDVRTAYRTLQWALDSATVLTTAESLGKANVKAQSEDYRSGLVTNIDVLNTINALQSVQTALSSAKWSAAYAAAELEVATGRSEK